MKLTIPNLLSLLRMGLVPLFIIAVLDGESRKALLIFTIAGVTDALDGFIARFWNQQSLLGAYLDPIADKIMMTAAYIVLAIPSLNQGVQIPAWVTVLVIARDLLIVVMVLILYLAGGVRKFSPTILSKITTLFQIVAVVAVLLSALATSLEPLASTLINIAGVLTVASGLDYIYRTARMPTQPAE